VCARHSRGYLRHLFSVAEPSAARLLTLHNVAWTLQLMTAAHEAIEEQRFDRFREDVLRVWG
jgi:queuine tRNA-ribosyltransferase